MGQNGSNNIEKNKRDTYDENVMSLAVLAGHILLENGAEIRRVETNMRNICEHFGVKSDNEFVLSNGIITTSGSEDEHLYAKVEHIPVGAPHLFKVAAVNQLTYEIRDGKYDLEQATEQMYRIKDMRGKSDALMILGSGVGSAAFTYFFGGDIIDSACAFVVGLVLYLFLLKVASHFRSKITANLLGSLLLTVLCCVFALTMDGRHLAYMIIGSSMPLIPGVAFVNAMREIADGDYISGAVRLMDAMVVFIAMAIGAGAAIIIMNTITGGGILI